MTQALITRFGVVFVAALLAGWAALAFLTKAWVKHRFDRAVEELKHRQTGEIETLKARLELLRVRFEKLHDQEFVVLPEVWSRMAEAMETMIAASDPQRIHPSTIGMNKGELEEYLERAPLLVWEKGAIKDFDSNQQAERDAVLHNMLDWAGYRKARELAESFRFFLQTRRIFMSAELTRELDSVAGTLNEAVSEFRRFLDARQAGRPIDLLICPKLKAESIRMANAVQAEIRKKLYPVG